jgi:hypothetical protein
MREAIDSRLPFTQQKESAYQKNVLDAIRNNTKEAMQNRGVNETGAQLKSGAEASNPGMEIPNLGSNSKHYKSQGSPNDYSELIEVVMNLVKTPVTTTRNMFYQPPVPNQTTNVSQQQNQGAKSELRYQFDQDLKNKITEHFEKEFAKIKREKDISQEIIDNRCLILWTKHKVDLS